MRAKSLRFLFLATAFVARPGPSAGDIQDVPPDWQAPDRPRCEVVRADASAFLGESYRPDLVHDGDRRTKWVSPTRPSAAAPQWIALTIHGGVQEVAAVAVFGERTDNDGILDAEVQVERGGVFETVASIRDAKSPSWLALFEPVRTEQVRLLVSRSAGPTDHTDVFEVEVYGRVLSATEMRSHLMDLLAGTQRALSAALQASAAPGLGGPELSRVAANPFRAVEGLRMDLERHRAEAALWDSLESADRCALLEKVHAAARFAEEIEERLALRSVVSTRQSPLLAAGRAKLRNLAERSVVREALLQGGPEMLLLSSGRLLLAVDPAGEGWDAIWGEETDVAVIGARFSADATPGSLTAGVPTTSVRDIEDPLGRAREIHQVWRRGGLRVERQLRIYEGCGVLTIGGSIANESGGEVQLETARLLDCGNGGGTGGGWWRLGTACEVPAAVYIEGQSTLRSIPFGASSRERGITEREYGAGGMLCLAGRDPAAVLTIGYVRADEAGPQLSARFRRDEGGTRLEAVSRFLGRVLGPGESVELNRLYVSGGRDAFESLESFGDAMAKWSPRPVRTGATSLWCSWYAHRMGMTEGRVLANAEVVARYFKPLGMEIIQLDHGWQRGDITGDWVPNERFPHGLKWLADQLRERFGLRLGVWISPTDVAESSEVFKRHPEWMLKGSDGKPQVNWRWYWVPNPNCYELDATHPDAYRYIEDCFRTLADWGVSYYKIDFIAPSGSDAFIQHDRKATRGWSVLRQAMRAVRSGAGEGAWVRFCQTPPILSAGLANGAYGGNDTLDAGVPGRFDLLRDNAHILAAGYWLNDKPYHREVCDMSIRMHASVEEARFRAAMMTLAGCSISISDELCYLPPSRIRLVTQCLPPGNPLMRPIDLFEQEIPSVWHIRARNDADAWDFVGLFNFGNQPETRELRFDAIGLDGDALYAVFEFWEEKLLGLRKNNLEVRLPPESCRLLSIRRVGGRPQLVGTDMHLLQGYHELLGLTWDEEKGVLSGVYSRMPGIRGRAFFHVPDGFSPRFDFPLSPSSARLTHVEGQLWMQELEFVERKLTWSIPFDVPKRTEANGSPARPPPGEKPSGVQ